MRCFPAIITSHGLVFPPKYVSNRIHDTRDCCHMVVYWLQCRTSHFHNQPTKLASWHTPLWLLREEITRSHSKYFCIKVCSLRVENRELKLEFFALAWMNVYIGKGILLPLLLESFQSRRLIFLCVQAEFGDLNLASYSDSGTMVDIQVYREGTVVVR